MISHAPDADPPATVRLLSIPCSFPWSPSLHPPMFSDSDESTAVLITTRSAFEAETVAAALRQRGMAAQAIDTATTSLWAGAVGGAKVLVYQRELEDARSLLKAIRAEGAAVDWDTADVGPDFDAQKPSSRAAWTVVLILVLIGLGVLSTGLKRYDPVLQALGAAALLLAMIIGGAAWMADSRGTPR